MRERILSLPLMLAADKGYDSKEKRADLRKRGIRPQLPKRTYREHVSFVKTFELRR